MSDQRTITVPTLDQGDVTVREPVWCAGHADDEQLPQKFVDLGHRGPEHQLGNPLEPIAIALVSQYPNGSNSGAINLYVELSGLETTLDPAGVERLAEEFAAAAGQLSRLAAWVRILRGGTQ